MTRRMRIGRRKRRKRRKRRMMLRKRRKRVEQWRGFPKSGEGPPEAGEWRRKPSSKLNQTVSVAFRAGQWREYS